MWAVSSSKIGIPTKKKCRSEGRCIAKCMLSGMQSSCITAKCMKTLLLARVTLMTGTLSGYMQMVQCTAPPQNPANKICSTHISTKIINITTNIASAEN